MIIQNIIRMVIIATLIAGFHSSALADIITLKNGKTYEGIISARDDKTILLSIPDQMPLKIRRSTIESIEKSNLSPGTVGGKSREVEGLKFLSCGEYFKELKKVLPEAEKSIRVMMFFINYKGRPGYPANTLVNLLAAAKKRGVKVEVLLESSSTEDNITEANRQAAEFLHKNGVDVKIFPYYPIMHVKLIIIDDYITILGSHNWTMASTRSNVESSILIESEWVAEEYQRYFRKNYNQSFPYTGSGS